MVAPGRPLESDAAGSLVAERLYAEYEDLMRRIEARALERRRVAEAGSSPDVSALAGWSRPRRLCARWRRR